MLSAGKISCCILTEINPGEILIKTYSTKTVSYGSTSHKNVQKQNNKVVFFQLFYAWLHLTNNNIPPPYL